MQQRIGRYEIIETVAAGGQATVYRARDTQLGRIVALKVMHPHLSGEASYVERFVREARMAASLSHPNVAVIYEVGEEGGANFIAMEFVPATLDALLKERGALPWDEARSLLLQIARALRAAERQGIVHRDLKPQNILLDEDGQAKVADFGIARAAEFGTMTATGMVLGTPQYMSPEQAKGQRVDTRSDLYALGVVLCQMLTGQTPLQGTTPQEVMRHHLLEQDAPLDALADANVPTEAASIVRRLLAKDPADRVADPQALIDLVEAAGAPAQPTAASPPAPAPPADPQPAPAAAAPPQPAPTAPTPAPSQQAPAAPTGRRYRIWRWAGALGLLLVTVIWFGLAADEFADDTASGLLVIAALLAAVSVGLLLLGRRGRGRATSVLVVGSLITGIWGAGMIPTASVDGGLGGGSFATPTPTATARPPTPTVAPPPVAFAGFDLPLEEGTFWEYDWTYLDRSCAQGSGCSTDEDAGTFVVSLGPGRTVDGALVFELQVTGKSAVDLPSVFRDFAPRWRYLGVDADGIVGSDGFSLTRLFNARTGKWAGSGYFTDRLDPEELIAATSGELTDAFAIATWPGVRTGPVVLAGRASSQSPCEIIEGLRICPREDTFSFTETEFFRAGVGPLGYRWNSTASFSGGNFFSSSESTEWVGLVGSSLRGDVATEPTPTPTVTRSIRIVTTPVPRVLPTRTPTPTPSRLVVFPRTPTPTPTPRQRLLFVPAGGTTYVLREFVAEDGRFELRMGETAYFGYDAEARIPTIAGLVEIIIGPIAVGDTISFARCRQSASRSTRLHRMTIEALGIDYNLERGVGDINDPNNNCEFTFTAPGEYLIDDSTDPGAHGVAKFIVEGEASSVVVSGSLFHIDDGSIEVAWAGAHQRDLTAEAVFANPYSTSDGSWSHGIMFRRSDVNNFHAVGIRSDGSWFHEVRTGSVASSNTVASGFLSDLDLSAFGANQVRVVAQGDQGYLFLNGVLVDQLDLREWGAAGDVGVMAGFFTGDEVPGRSTDYKGFDVSPVTLQGGPISGEIQHEVEAIAGESIAGSLTNFIAEARFTNPYGASVGSWDYGFGFRNPAFGELHVIVVLSDGRWVHEVRTATLESWAEVAQGEGSFGTAAGDSNLVRLIAVDDTGWLFVNGELAAALDLSVVTGPSGVLAITGFFQGNSIPGRSTSFADFTVWSLD